MKKIKKVIAIILITSIISPTFIYGVSAYEDWVSDTTLVIEGEARIGNTLRAKIGEEEPEGVLFEWRRSDSPNSENDGAPIEGANAASYQISDEDRGKYIYVIIRGDGIKYELFYETISDKTKLVIGQNDDTENLNIDDNEEIIQGDEKKIEEAGTEYLEQKSTEANETKKLRNSNDVLNTNTVECDELLLPESGNWTYQGITFTEAQVIFLHEFFDDSWERLGNYTVYELINICHSYSHWYNNSLEGETGTIIVNEGALPKSGEWTYQGVTFTFNQVKFFNEKFAYTGNAAELITHYSAKELIKLCNGQDLYGYIGTPEEKEIEQSEYVVTGSIVYDTYKTGNILSVLGVDSNSKCTWYRVSNKDEYENISSSNIVAENSKTYETSKEDADKYFFAVVDDNQKTNLHGAMHNIYWCQNDKRYQVMGTPEEYKDTTVSTLRICGNSYEADPESITKVTWYAVPNETVYKNLKGYETAEDYVISTDTEYNISEQDVGKYIFAVYERCNTDVRQYKSGLIGPIKSISEIGKDWIATPSERIVTGTSPNGPRAVGSTLSILNVGKTSKCTWYRATARSEAENVESDVEAEESLDVEKIAENTDSYKVTFDDLGKYVFAVYSTERNQTIQYKTNVLGEMFDYNNVTWECDDGDMVSGLPSSYVGSDNCTYNIRKCTYRTTWYAVPSMDIYSSLDKYEGSERYVVSRESTYAAKPSDVGKILFAVYEPNSDGDCQYKTNPIGPIVPKEREDVEWQKGPKNMQFARENMQIVSSGKDNMYVTGSVLSAVGLSNISRCTWYRVSSREEYTKLNNNNTSRAYEVGSGVSYRTTSADDNNYIFFVAESNGDFTKQYKSDLIGKFTNLPSNGTQNDVTSGNNSRPNDKETNEDTNSPENNGITVENNFIIDNPANVSAPEANERIVNDLLEHVARILSQGRNDDVINVSRNRTDSDISDVNYIESEINVVKQATVENAIEVIKESQNGQNIEVIMKGNRVVTKETLDAVRGKDINVTFDMGDYSWTINGADIGLSDLSDINLAIEMNNNVIPANTIGEITNGNDYQTLSLIHDGPFGFKATLSISVDRNQAGKYGNLYYYNKNNELEFQGAGLVSEDGVLQLKFVHASEYVIVFDEVNRGELEKNDAEINKQSQRDISIKSSQDVYSRENNASLHRHNTSKKTIPFVITALGGIVTIIVLSLIKKKKEDLYV